MSTLTAPWWIWRSVQTRLIKWTLLLLSGRKYVVELTTKIDTDQTELHRAVEEHEHDKNRERRLDENGTPLSVH